VRNNGAGLSLSLRNKSGENIWEAVEGVRPTEGERSGTGNRNIRFFPAVWETAGLSVVLLLEVSSRKVDDNHQLHMAGVRLLAV
jgi:hypothetical protein